MYLIFDGDDERLITQEELTTMSTAEIIDFYQSTLIYHNEAVAIENNRLYLTTTKRLKTALQALLEKMSIDLGEETALYIAAKSDLDLKLHGI